MCSCCCDPATASGGIEAHGEGKDLSFFPSDPLILLSMDGSRTVNMPGSGIDKLRDLLDAGIKLVRVFTPEMH
jgi:hypothetical protein